MIWFFNVTFTMLVHNMFFQHSLCACFVKALVALYILIISSMFLVEMSAQIFLVWCSKLTFLTIISQISMFSFDVTFQMVLVAPEFTQCTFIFCFAMISEMFHQAMSLVCRMFTVFARKVFSIVCKILFQNGSSLILNFVVYFCIVFSILFCLS